MESILLENSLGICSECKVIGHGHKKLVMIGGLFCDYTIWNEQINLLKSEHKLYILYPPCHGRSDILPGVSDFFSIAEHMLNSLNTLNISNATLIGWSLGGIIAQAMALKNPSLFSQLILISTSGREVIAGEKGFNLMSEERSLCAMPYYSKQSIEFYRIYIQRFFIIVFISRYQEQYINTLW